MKIHDCVQYTPEWWELRCGVPTASEMHRVMTPTGKPAAAQEDYINQLVADRVCQTPNFFTGNADMKEGTRREPESRKWFEYKFEVEITEVGFVTSEDGRFGASPDGLLLAKGEGVELKNPNRKTHVAYLREPELLLKEYLAQVHGSLLVSGCDAWHLCAYTPPFPAVHLVVRPDDYTKKLADEMDRFWEKYLKVRQLVEGMK